jgi:hypothetical protein
MTSINPPAQATASKARRRNFGLGWLGTAGRVWAYLWRSVQGTACSAANEHLLKDIGETRSHAEIEALQSMTNAPLGSLGLQSESNKRPLFSSKLSPLS